MRKTLAQAKAASSGIVQSVGIPACDARFTALLNRGQSRLADMGKWWGTYQRLRTCVVDNCITWPREVKVVEGFIQCNWSIPVRTTWYDFMENTRAPNVDDCGCIQAMLMDRGIVCQFRDITGPSYIRLYPSIATDAGKRVLLQGIDPNGIPIRTLDGSVWVDGEYVTLAYPFVTSTNIFKNPGLTGVQKPVTNGRVTAFGVLASTSEETQIAYWEPSEENPAYRRSWLTNRAHRCGNQEGYGCRDKGDGCNEALENCTGITADTIIRREFIPALVDSDWLFISNLTAIQHIMKAVQKEDQNQYDLAEQETQRALRALRNELDAYSPPQQIKVNVETHGTARPVRIFGGFV